MNSNFYVISGFRRFDEAEAFALAENKKAQQDGSRRTYTAMDNGEQVSDERRFTVIEAC